MVIVRLITNGLPSLLDDEAFKFYICEFTSDKLRVRFTSLKF